MSAYTIRRNITARVERAFKGHELREKRPLVIEEIISRADLPGQRSLNMAAHKPPRR